LAVVGLLAGIAVLWSATAGCTARSKSGDQEPAKHASADPDSSKKAPETADEAAVEKLCERVRTSWSNRKAEDLATLVWPECYTHYGAGAGGSQAEVVSWEQLQRQTVEVWKQLERIEPGSEPPIIEINGSIAVIRWTAFARVFSGGAWSPPGQGLEVAVRRNGEWRRVASVLGDWQLTEADRFDAKNPDHGAIQAFFDKLNEVFSKKEAGLVAGLHHDVFLGIAPDSQQPGTVLTVDRDACVKAVSQMIRDRDYREHRREVLRLKVGGPLAVVLTDLHETVDGQSQTRKGNINVLCRSPAGWRVGLWVDGDWTKVVTGPGR
jgi:hypothetical protein